MSPFHNEHTQVVAPLFQTPTQCSKTVPAATPQVPFAVFQILTLQPIRVWQTTQV